MPTPINGAEVLLAVNTGTEAVPAWWVIASQTGVNFKADYPEINASGKQDASDVFLPGRGSETCTLTYYYVPGDAGSAALKQAARARERIKIRRQEEGDQIEEAYAVITSRGEDFPDQAPGTINVDIRVSGGWLPI